MNILTPAEEQDLLEKLLASGWRLAEDSPEEEHSPSNKNNT